MNMTAKLKPSPTQPRDLIALADALGKMASGDHEEREVNSASLRPATAAFLRIAGDSKLPGRSRVSGCSR